MAMFGMLRRKKEPALRFTGPYPGLLPNPRMVFKDFDADHSLPLVRYRILVKGKELAAGEFHCEHEDALSSLRSQIPGRGRSARRAKEIEAYDSEGKLLGRDRQVWVRHGGVRMAVWESAVIRGRETDKIDAEIRKMGPAFPF